MQYRLRTLLIVLALGPPLLAALIALWPQIIAVGSSFHGSYNYREAQIVCGLLNGAAELYELDVGEPPPNLDALLQMPSDLPNPTKWAGPYLDKPQLPVDPWNNAYQYELLGKGGFRIWSLGPDGLSGSWDDIARRRR